MKNDIVKQLREIANTLENSDVNCKKIEITEDEIRDLIWCIETIKSILQFESVNLTEVSQNRLIEVNKYLSRIYVRNLHL